MCKDSFGEQARDIMQEPWGALLAHERAQKIYQIYQSKDHKDCDRLLSDPELVINSSVIYHLCALLWDTPPVTLRNVKGTKDKTALLFSINHDRFLRRVGGEFADMTGKKSFGQVVQSYFNMHKKDKADALILSALPRQIHQKIADEKICMDVDLAGIRLDYRTIKAMHKSSLKRPKSLFEVSETMRRIETRLATNVVTVEREMDIVSRKSLKTILPAFSRSAAPNETAVIHVRQQLLERVQLPDEIMQLHEDAVERYWQAREAGHETEVLDSYRLFDDRWPEGDLWKLKAIARDHIARLNEAYGLNLPIYIEIVHDDSNLGGFAGNPDFKPNAPWKGQTIGRMELSASTLKQNNFLAFINTISHEYTHALEFLFVSGFVPSESPYPIVSDEVAAHCQIIFGFNDHLMDHGQYFKAEQYGCRAYTKQLRERHADFIGGLWENVVENAPELQRPAPSPDEVAFMLAADIIPYMNSQNSSPDSQGLDRRGPVLH